MNEEHEGGWLHLDIWVQWDKDGGTPDDAKEQSEPLMDEVARVLFPWCKERGLDPYFSGSLNASTPDWAVG